jgi:hypothetical protein
MKTNKIDIKSLTSEIKNLTRNKPLSSMDTVSTDESTPKESENKVQQPNEKDNQNEEVSRFLEFIKEVNSKDHYQIDRFIYVDADIHEVFNKLKTHTRLKLSHLVSHLLESFILQHQESIKAIISKKQNKFLDV